MAKPERGKPEPGLEELSQQPRELLEQNLKELAEDGTVSCPVALALAHRMGISPLHVGWMADDLGLRIVDCQLGCFGAGKRAKEDRG